MDINKILKICVICIIIGLEFVLSLPTFGEEYVHIKVHLPHDSKHVKGHVKPKHKIVHHVPIHHVRHKVIHHYSQRKPVKKVIVKETAPLLENHYLSELDKHHHVPEHSHGNNKHIEQTFLITEEHRHSKPTEEVKTIKVIEKYEHQPKVIEKYEHQPKVIEKYEHQPKVIEKYEHQPKTHVETIKLIETVEEHHPLPKQHYHQQEDHVKFVEEKPQYHAQPQQHHQHYPQQHHHQVPHVEEIIEEELIYHAPQVNAIQNKPSLPKGYFKNNDVENQILHGIIEESLNILKTKQAKNHNYQQHYDFQTSKDQAKATEEYNHYQGTANADTSNIGHILGIQQKYVATGHNIGRQQLHTSAIESSKDQTKTQEEYNHYQAVAIKDSTNIDHNIAHQQHYGQTKQEIPVYENTPDFGPQQHYGPPKDEHLPSGKLFTPHQHYGPPKHDTSEYEQLSGGKNFVPHQHYGPPSVFQEDKQKFAGDYEKFLPSAETPQDFNSSHNNYDDLNSKDDFSNAVQNPHAPETYTGYDSYNAVHVQGIGSGGYLQHTPLAEKKK